MHHSTDLVNLFVAVGKAGLNNMMASHASTTDRRVFIIKTFKSSDDSCATVRRYYRKEVCVEPMRYTSYRTVKQFEEI